MCRHPSIPSFLPLRPSFCHSLALLRWYHPIVLQRVSLGNRIPLPCENCARKWRNGRDSSRRIRFSPRPSAEKGLDGVRSYVSGLSWPYFPPSRPAVQPQRPGRRPRPRCDSPESRNTCPVPEVSLLRSSLWLSRGSKSNVMQKLLWGGRFV